MLEILVALMQVALAVMLSAVVAWKVTGWSLGYYLRQREIALRKLLKGVL